MHPKGIAGWIIRGLQFAFNVIVLAISAALVANQPSGGSPSQVNYAVFVGVVSNLTWFYTVIASSMSPDGIGSPVIIVILDSLNILWLVFCTTVDARSSRQQITPDGSVQSGRGSDNTNGARPSGR